jgi:hypothetical protein
MGIVTVTDLTLSQETHDGCPISPISCEA